MAVIAGLTNSFKQEILEGVHDLSSDTINIALYKPSADLIPSTTVYSATEEVTSTNYVAGGATLTNNGIVRSGDTVYLDFVDYVWSNVSFTVRGALIYNSESGKGNKSIAVLDFGLDIEVSSGTFTVKFPTADANDAIIRIK